MLTCQYISLFRQLFNVQFIYSLHYHKKRHSVFQRMAANGSSSLPTSEKIISFYYQVTLTNASSKFPSEHLLLVSFWCQRHEDWGVRMTYFNVTFKSPLWKTLCKMKVSKDLNFHDPVNNHQWFPLNMSLREDLMSEERNICQDFLLDLLSPHEQVHGKLVSI